LVLYYRKNGSKQNQLGITVSGKLGKAVVRNKVRRRLREIYRNNEAQFLPGYNIVVVARVRAVSRSYEELERSFLQLAEKSNLLRLKGGESQ
jgi:ribonuclease P protein component